MGWSFSSIFSYKWSDISLKNVLLELRLKTPSQIFVFFRKKAHHIFRVENLKSVAGYRSFLSSFALQTLQKYSEKVPQIFEKVNFLKIFIFYGGDSGLRKKMNKSPMIWLKLSVDGVNFIHFGDGGPTFKKNDPRYVPLWSLINLVHENGRQALSFSDEFGENFSFYLFSLLLWVRLLHQLQSSASSDVIFYQKNFCFFEVFLSM